VTCYWLYYCDCQLARSAYGNWGVCGTACWIFGREDRNIRK